MRPSPAARLLRRFASSLVLVLCAVALVSVSGSAFAHTTASQPAAAPDARVPTSAPIASATAPAKKQLVVVIDAGHQAKADLRLEPIGPGSKKKKPRVAGGTSGIVTHNRESAINLQVALKLRTALRKKGVKVVMIRTKQKVNISNSSRAKIANAAGADLCVRIHCDGSTNHKIHGLLVVVPAKNSWTKKFYARSYTAGKDVLGKTVSATKAKNRGISKRGDMTGFNWSKVPTIIVEMGLMTNATEDRNLAKKSYQAKLVSGMTKGVMKYLER